MYVRSRRARFANQLWAGLAIQGPSMLCYLQLGSEKICAMASIRATLLRFPLLVVTLETDVSLRFWSWECGGVDGVGVG